MKVYQMTKDNRPVANHFIIHDDQFIFLQSYKVIVARIPLNLETIEDGVVLDKVFYNYSKTTSKYVNFFLHCTSKEREERIKNETYILDYLNPKEAYEWQIIEWKQLQNLTEMK